MAEKQHTAACSCGNRISTTDFPAGGAPCPQCGRPLPGAVDPPESSDSALRPAAAEPTDWPIEHVPAEWNVGDVILGLYEVSAILGEGGMGKVYKVHHRGWGMDLAVKSPRAEILQRPGGAARFEAECATWIDLGLHPHTVSCYYVRRLGGIPRVFAEFVEDGSLWDAICNKRLYEGDRDTALTRMLDTAIQAAWGLQHAHDRGFVHQDVKPANVLLTPDGLAKVADFGLARALTLEENGLPMGMTRAYRAPEQVARQESTPRTDLWGWGLTVLQMFTRKVAWKLGEEAPQALEGYLGRIHKAPPFLPVAPPELIELLRRCFALDPDRRPRDMREATDVLRGIYENLTGAPYPRREPRPAETLSDGLNNRAISLLDLGRQQEAMRQWKEALATDPQHPESVYNLGLLKWRVGRLTDDAFLARLHESARLHPDDPLTPYRFAQVHLERGDYAAALRLLEGSDDAVAPTEVIAAREAATARRDRTRRLLKGFPGHNDTITAAELSDDGKQALSGSEDNTVRLWDVEKGECLRVFEGHTNTVRAVRLSLSGHFGVSAGDDRTIRLWNLGTGACLRVLEGHTGVIKDLSLGANDRYLLSAGEDKTLRLWDLETGICRRSFEGHTHWVNAGALSADGRRILSGGIDRTVRLWDAGTGASLHVIHGHEAPIEAVCIEANGGWGLSADRRGAIHVWDLTDGKCLDLLDGHEGAVHSLALSEDGRHALSGGKDGTVRLWEMRSGRCLFTYRGHEGPVTAVSLGLEGLLALSVGTDRTLRVWLADCHAWVVPATLMACRTVSSEAASSAGAAFQKALALARRARARGDARESARLVETARSQPGRRRAPEVMEEWRKLYSLLPKKRFAGAWEVEEIDPRETPLKQVVLMRRGRYALSLSGPSTLRMWDLSGGRCRYAAGGEAGVMDGISVSEDGRWVAAAGWSLSLWEVLTGSHVRTFERPAEPLHSVALSPDAQYVLSGGAVGTVRLWQASTGRCLRSLGGHSGDVTAVAFGPDGRYALTGAEDQILVLWDVARGRPLRILEGQTGTPRAISISADGRRALVASTGSWDRPGELRLWDLLAGQCSGPFEGHAGNVNCAALSPNGLLAISGADDRTARLWDADTGRCLATLENHAEPVVAATFTPDGGHALTAGRDGAMRLWFLDWELDEKEPADWDESVRPYIEAFLTRLTPYGNKLPLDGVPPDHKIQAALRRHGKPNLTDDELERFLRYLGAIGYGWVRPDSLRTRIRRMAASWNSPPEPYGGRALRFAGEGIAQRLRGLLGR